MRLMLIEDDRTYAWLVEEMLVEAFPSEDMDVQTFGSLEEATAETRAVDCALVDLSLPDASGMRVIETVIAAMPDLPLVVLTGAEDEQLALQAVDRGAQDYLVKRRVDPEILGRSVRYAIERKRSESQRAELLRARAAHAEAEALSGVLTRLQEVADAAIPVQGRLDYGELLDRTLAVISADLGALILQPANGPATFAAVRALDHVRADMRVADDGIAARILAASDPLLVDSIEDTDAGQLGPDAGLRSLVAVPLEADGRRIGSLVAGSALADRFSDEQARLLALAGERCARAMANAAAYERERRTAAALQAGLLPHGVPKLKHGQVAVRYLPAQGGLAVGGDWYDVIALPDGRVGLAIGDVTGHGAEAAVMMGQLRTALRAYALEGSPPSLVVSRLNQLTLTLSDEAMATLVYAVLDANLSSGSFVNAGHPPPILISADGARPLEAHSGPPAGASASTDFQEHAFMLDAGDALLLYSDGLVEERGAVTPEREEELLAALGTPAPAEVLCERALASLRPNGAAADDVALLVLQTSETGGGGGLTSTHPAAAEELGAVRARLRDWLEAIGADRNELSEIQLATNEACMNVIEHAYEEEGSGEFTVEGHLDGRTVVLIVRDAGRWSEVRARGRGRGLKLMEALMDSVQLSFSSEGTVVVLRRALNGA